MKHSLTPGGIAVEVDEPPPTAPLEDGCAFVLEGYPRSANTFCAYAFERSNPGVIFAHHHHDAGRVLLGIAAHLPCLVLIRDPIDACASFCVYDQTLTVERSLRRWDLFYRTLLPHLGRFTLATFEQVTTDFGAVLAHLPFSPFEHTPQAAASILHEIRSNAGLRHWQAARIGGADDEARVRMLAAPSRARARLLREARLEVEAHPLALGCLDLYEGLLTRTLDL